MICFNWIRIYQDLSTVIRTHLKSLDKVHQRLYQRLHQRLMRRSTWTPRVTQWEPSRRLRQQQHIQALRRAVTLRVKSVHETTPRTEVIRLQMGSNQQSVLRRVPIVAAWVKFTLAKSLTASLTCTKQMFQFLTREAQARLDTLLAMVPNLEFKTLLVAMSATVLERKPQIPYQKLNTVLTAMDLTSAPAKVQCTTAESMTKILISLSVLNRCWAMAGQTQFQLAIFFAKQRPLTVTPITVTRSSATALLIIL